MVILVLLEVSLQLLDHASLEELHGHGQLLAAFLGGAHELELIIECLEHILLLLGGAPDLLVPNIVNLELNLGDSTLHLLLDELVEPLFIEGELHRRVRPVATRLVVVLPVAIDFSN